VLGDPTKFDPTIADVHTQPTDAARNPVGRVLHVGTGNSRLMIITTNSCTGPRAYAGLVFSYYEKITENFDRLTDERWATEVKARTPVDVAWMSDLRALSIVAVNVEPPPISQSIPPRPLDELR
jgi:uncharacterized protein DUF3160